MGRATAFFFSPAPVPPGALGRGHSVPIHVELRVIHSEIVKITHTFQYKNVHSRTFFPLKIRRNLSLFIYSSESLINFILFGYLMLF